MIRSCIRFAALLAAISTLWLTGCTSTVKPGPGAATQRDVLLSSYPESIYLRVIGSGPGETEARDRAVAEMSRIFHSKIDSAMVDVVSSSRKSGGEEELDESVYARVQVVSSTEIEGIEIPRVWTEGKKKKKTFYALAVLERQKCTIIWRHRIKDIDKALVAMLQKSRKRNSPLFRSKILKEAPGLLSERAAYVSMLNVIGSSAPEPVGYDPATVLVEVKEIKGSLKVFVDITGSPVFAAVLSDGLASSGVVLTHNEKEADVIVRGEVVLEQLNLEDKDWKYARISASLTVTDTETGLSLAKPTDNVRAAHLTFQEAASKAVNKLAGKMVELVMGSISL